MATKLPEQTLSKIHREFVLRGLLSEYIQPLTYYGWQGVQSIVLRRRISEEIPRSNLIAVKIMFATTAKIAKKSNSGNDSNPEYIVFTNNKKNHFSSLLHHRHNSFAHGRVAVILRGGDSLLQINDSHRGKGNMRVCVQLSTLVRIRELIDAGSAQTDPVGDGVR